jgi:uncharacterized membrane protein (UPF0136 family)
MTIDPLTDTRVIHHLDAVAAVLTQQGNDQVATQVIEHLRGHIVEAVRAHASDPDPIAKALAELDAPTDYKEIATLADLPATLPRNRRGDIALIFSLSGPFCGIAVGIAATPFGNGESIGWLLHCAMQLTAIGIALSALRQFRARIAIAVALGMVVIPMLLALLGKQT